MQTATTDLEAKPASRKAETSTPLSALRAHWPEFLMEGAELGLFMVSACFFTALLEHPSSPAWQANVLLRRFLEGLAMGLTLLALVFSPWGKRSGAHMNPAFTLSFYLLGKVERWDAVFYAIAQFAGGILGVVFSILVIGAPVRHAAVNYVVTVPGPGGPPIALAGEFIISLMQMSAVLIVSNHKRLSRFTPFVAATLLATYITFEAPLSGMSMNPARTLGSALPAHVWTALWVYFLAPPVAMALAGQLYRFRRGAHRVFCAKLHHYNDERCIFRCNYAAM
jgi:aquaporin Z